MGRPRGQHTPQTILGDPSDRFAFPAMVDRFVADRAVKGYAVETIRVERGHLAKWARWLGTQGVTHPADVTPAIVEEYQRFLHDYRKSDGTALTLTSQGAAIGPIKRFYEWGVLNGHLASNPTTHLRMPRREVRLPTSVLTIAEAGRVLALPDTDTVRGLRDRAIMETLYSTGIRRGELARLMLSDVDRGRRTLLIRQGKGRKDRIVPIGARAVGWIDQYLELARPQLQPADPHALFLSSDGFALTPHRLTGLVAGYVDRAGIFKHGGCHLFRHTLATLMIDSGADIRYVQAMLGHANLSSTQIYTHVSMTALQAVHAATFADQAPRTPRRIRHHRAGHLP